MSKLRPPHQRYIRAHPDGFRVLLPAGGERLVKTHGKAIKLRNKLWGHPPSRYYNRKARTDSTSGVPGVMIGKARSKKHGKNYDGLQVKAVVIAANGKRVERKWSIKKWGRDEALRLGAKWRRETLKANGHTKA